MTGFRRDDKGTPLVADPTRTTKDGKPAIVKYSRPSGFVKAIEDTYNLQKWSERRIVAGIAHALHDPFESQKVEALLDTIRHAAHDRSTDTDCDAVIATAKALAQTSLAADRGTWVHTMTELIDMQRKPSAEFVAEGEALGIDRTTMKVIGAAWRTLLADHGIDVLDVELPVVNDEFRTAGTLDRLVELGNGLRFVTANGEVIDLPAGNRMVLDIKTGDRKSGQYWKAYSAQIYLYANSVRYDTETDTRRPHPFEVDTRWGLLAHIDVKAAIGGRTDIASLLLVDLQDGRDACVLAAGAKVWRKRTDVFHALYATIAAPVDGPPVTVEQPPAGDAPSPSRPGGHLTPRQQADAVPAVADSDDTRSAKDWVDLEGRYKRLGDNGRAFMTQLMGESMQAGVSWHQRERRTDRRWWLYDAAIALAEQGYEVDCAMEAMRALVAHIVDADWPLFPTITLGHAYGSLTADEAERLALAVREFDRGGFVADLDRDVLELKRAA